MEKNGTTSEFNNGAMYNENWNLYTYPVPEFPGKIFIQIPHLSNVRGIGRRGTSCYRYNPQPCAHCFMMYNDINNDCDYVVLGDSKEIPDKYLCNEHFSEFLLDLFELYSDDSNEDDLEQSSDWIFEPAQDFGSEQKLDSDLIL